MKGLSEIVLGGNNKLFSMNAGKEVQIPAILSNMQDNAYNVVVSAFAEAEISLYLFKLKGKLMIFKHEKSKMFHLADNV